MIKRGELKKNFGRIATAVLLLVLTLLAAVSGITFAKLYGVGEGESAPSAIAVPVARSGYKQIFRTDAAGKREAVSFGGGATSVTVKDVEPEDILDIYYYVTDTDGLKINEVLLETTVTVCVRLEMLMQETGSKREEYFAGWKEYNTAEDGVKNGGLLQIYGVSGGMENEIRPSRNTSGKVDYSGGVLLTETEGEAIYNKFGLYMEPNGYSSEYVYHIRFVLPKQNAETENYAGARLYIDINALFEQSAGI